MSPRPRSDATDAELAVLRALWDRGAATIRELTDQLYPDPRAAGYATVQKLLERLEGKGFVRRERDEVPHRFHAAVGRDELIAQRLAALADSLCEGSLAPLLTHLVGGSKLNDAERDELRRLVDELDDRGSRGER